MCILDAAAHGACVHTCSYTVYIFTSIGMHTKTFTQAHTQASHVGVPPVFGFVFVCVHAYVRAFGLGCECREHTYEQVCVYRPVHAQGATGTGIKYALSDMRCLHRGACLVSHACGTVCPCACVSVCACKCAHKPLCARALNCYQTSLISQRPVP